MGGKFYVLEIVKVVYADKILYRLLTKHDGQEEAEEFLSYVRQKDPEGLYLIKHKYGCRIAIHSGEERLYSFPEY
jgi:hypothetical protein